MDDLINDDTEMKRRAWNMHFAPQKTNNRFKFAKREKRKFTVKWVKQKDEKYFIERWTKITVPNEKYDSEDGKEGEKVKSEIKRDAEVNPEKNVTRRSYRLNLQSIFQENLAKKNYQDPPSDLGMCIQRDYISLGVSLFPCIGFPFSCEGVIDEKKIFTKNAHSLLSLPPV
ncbi:conserved Plasmodium protein, unknown function [Plasmodium ovale]|uniref:Uncharacterized protein n=1 Tax=Plasmodium ovale TaxID=36330 RepID=A0A1D3TGB4_PLAOA|nr:conserved Plasmodium protein, unknown function [Plasmodium ovale]